MVLYYWPYRKAGGIKGHSHKANKILNKVASTSKNLYLNKAQDMKPIMDDSKANQLTEGLMHYDDEEGAYEQRGTLALTNGPEGGCTVEDYEDPKDFDKAPEPYVDPRDLDRAPPSHK